LGNVQRHTLSGGEVTAFAQAHGLEKLHAGESECLYLCQRVGVSTLLTDDLTVREAAKRLNVTTGGFLGRCRQGIPTGTHLAI
jgi:predicted nucleic acid-binding protein